MPMPASRLSVAAAPVPALVVMGVSGCGKTDTSLAVARRLGYRHIEADRFHLPSHVERMRAGIPLTDADRFGWLDRLVAEMRAAQAAGEGFVLSCSALKRSYRERLRAAAPGLRFAHLQVDPMTALHRVGGRPGHFMPISLVDSQFATLEDPAGEAGVLSVDSTAPFDEVVARICQWMQADPAGTPDRPLAVTEPVPPATEAPPLTGVPLGGGALARAFDRLTDTLMALLLAVMVVAVFANVVGRYLFATGWAGAEELSRLAFVWLVFVGVTSGLRRGELMRFTLLRDRLGAGVQRLVDSLGWLLVAAASVLCAWGAWNQVRFGWGNQSPVLAYPVVLAMVPVLAGMAALAVLALAQLVCVWRPQGPRAPARANVTAD